MPIYGSLDAISTWDFDIASQDKEKKLQEDYRNVFSQWYNATGYGIKQGDMGHCRKLYARAETFLDGRQLPADLLSCFPKKFKDTKKYAGLFISAALNQSGQSSLTIYEDTPIENIAFYGVHNKHLTSYRNELFMLDVECAQSIITNYGKIGHMGGLEHFAGTENIFINYGRTTYISGNCNRSEKSIAINFGECYNSEIEVFVNLGKLERYERLLKTQKYTVFDLRPLPKFPYGRIEKNEKYFLNTFDEVSLLQNIARISTVRDSEDMIRGIYTLFKAATTKELVENIQKTIYYF